tara:strand:- start:23616 stop:24278 length:663 start_codon:yes stop_codon:yes gene_type:complete
MSIGLVGKKIGMTRLFLEGGASVPVSVVEVLPNHITQIKTQEKEGHRAIQLTTGARKKSRVNKPASGHYAKANVEPGLGLWEFPLDSSDNTEWSLGGELTVERFSNGQKVDVTGESKGKGFAGCVKRHNFSMQDATHGNSLSHRAPGSIGQNQTPGRVFKGKKMAGQMGAVQKTVQNLEVVKVDGPKNLLLIKGAIPGAPGGMVIIKSAVKLVNQTAVTA